MTLTPTPDGWTLTVGCWPQSAGMDVATVADLRALIAGDEGWPEARGEEVARRRPLLAAVADLCDAHAAAHPAVIAKLAERWKAGQ